MSSHSGNLNYCLVVDGLYRNNKGGGERVIFRAVLLLAGLLPRVLFWDNKDAISNNLATRKLGLPELEGACLLFLGLEGQHTPQRCQIAKQSKLFVFFLISELNVDRDRGRGRGRREKLFSKEVARVEKSTPH